MEDTMNEWTNTKLCDVGNLVLGIVLFASPWVFNYPAGHESTNAMIAGIIIAVLSIAALAAFTVWEEWINLVVGLWLIVSPWVLHFAGTTAMYVAVVIGALVALLAGIELFDTAQSSTRPFVRH
jgi:SPW repeat